VRGVVTKVLYKHHLRVLQAAGQWYANWKPKMQTNGRSSAC